MHSSHNPQAFLLQQTQPPPSEVSAWTGFVGLAGLAVAFLLAFVFQKDLHPLWKSAELLALCALAMAVFELIRLKTYREVFKNITPRFIKTLRVPPRSDLFARMLGAILTLLPFALLYVVLNETLPGRYQSLLIGFVTGIPFVFALIAAYIVITPLKKDAYWHLGMVALRKQAYSRIPDAAEHWRQWALKAFFVPFMLSIVYGNVYILDQSLKNFTFELFHVFFVLQIAIFVVD